MHPLRQKFERELSIRGRAERMVHAYVAHIRALAQHYRTHAPDQLSDEQIHDWLYHLRTVRRLSPSTLNNAVQAVRAFHTLVLGRDPAAAVAGVARGRRPAKRPRCMR